MWCMLSKATKQRPLEEILFLICNAAYLLLFNILNHYCSQFLVRQTFMWNNMDFLKYSTLINNFFQTFPLIIFVPRNYYNTTWCSSNTAEKEQNNDMKESRQNESWPSPPFGFSRNQCMRVIDLADYNIIRTHIVFK